MERAETVGLVVAKILLKLKAKVAELLQVTIVYCSNCNLRYKTNAFLFFVSCPLRSVFSVYSGSCLILSCCLALFLLEQVSWLICFSKDMVMTVARMRVAPTTSIHLGITSKNVT